MPLPSLENVFQVAVKAHKEEVTAYEKAVDTVRDNTQQLATA